MCYIYSETPTGSYVKHLVSVMECSGRCSGSLIQIWQLLKGSSRQLCATAVLACVKQQAIQRATASGRRGNAGRFWNTGRGKANSEQARVDLWADSTALTALYHRPDSAAGMLQRSAALTGIYCAYADSTTVQQPACL